MPPRRTPSQPSEPEAPPPPDGPPDAPVDQTGLATTLAQRAAGAPEGPTLEQLLRRQEGAIERALPRVGITAERFTRLVLTEVRRTPRLASCEPMSILGAMMYSAQLGLEVGPLGHAYLVPYWNNQRRMLQAQFILGYRGILALAWRSQHLASIEARVVREGDLFDYEYGLDEKLRHRPAPDDQRGATTHYYGIARYTTGGRYWDVLSMADVEARRQRSASAEKGFSPWTSDYDAMGRKSVIRAMAPYMPLSAELAEALTTDEAVRVFDPDAAGATRVDGYPTGDVPPPDGEPPLDDQGEPQYEPADVGTTCADCGALAFATDEHDPLVEHKGSPYHASCVPRDDE